MMVLRSLIHEPKPIVERELRIDLPVVLQIPVNLIVKEAALDELRLLLVAREHSEGCVGETEAGIERVRGSLAKLMLPWNDAPPPAPRFCALTVIEIEAGLDGVAPLAFVRLIEKSCVRLMFMNPGKPRFGGAFVTRLPHANVGGSRTGRSGVRRPGRLQRLALRNSANRSPLRQGRARESARPALNRFEAGVTIIEPKLILYPAIGRFNASSN